MGFSRIWIFVDYLMFIFTASQLWINANSQTPPGYAIDVLSPISVQRGLCVHIPCTFTVPTKIRLTTRANGFWYRLNSQRKLTLVASRENGRSYTNGRVHLIGNVTRGDCSYYIEEPLRQDQSYYVFRMEDIQTKLTYMNIFPYVVVRELTEKPKISSPRLLDGKEVTLTCTSPGKCRNILSRISWEGTPTGVRQNIYNITYQDGSRTFHSNITFTPRKSHNKSPLFCRVTLEENLTIREKQTLNVEYSPSMDLIIEGADTNDPSHVMVKDGDSITLKCVVDSNPNSSVSLYKDDLVIYQNIRNQTVTLNLMNITLSDTGRFQCSAVNEHGVTERTMDIIYHSSTLRFSPVMAAAVGGVVFLGLIIIIIIGGLLIMFCRKKRQQNIKGNLKDMNINNTDTIYAYAEFTGADNHPQQDLLFPAVEDPVYTDPDAVQYSTIGFSNPNSKVIHEDVQTEYSETKKTQYH
ncbi:sialic acid-binding Ig-like lectin 13 [Hyla sarda]|uniref:sialic acid-binding Ig-like lectin 13 n=1 Tax=Hyla sarda TaxID=327740 RepID=UPI0024C3101E|nr:sialic acid-binding Ig-like lectin 13 [Hyla sarda]